MEKKDNKQKQSIFSSFGRMFKRLFSFGGKKKELNVFEEEEIKSPSKVIFSNFIHNKFTIIGLRYIGSKLVFCEIFVRCL